MSQMDELERLYHEERTRHSEKCTQLFIQAVMLGKYELAVKIDNEGSLNSFRITSFRKRVIDTDAPCSEELRDVFIRHKDLEEGTM